MSMQLLSSEGQSQEFHLFGSNQQIQAVRFMLGSTTVELKSTHLADGSTSLDVLLRQIETTSPRPPPIIAPASQHANAASPTTQGSNNPTIITFQEEHVQQAEAQLNGEQLQSSLARGEGADITTIQEEEYVKKMRGWIMVVATLFAAMTFQAGLNPPGGFWQDDLDSTTYSSVVLGNNTAAAAATFTLIISPPLSSILSSNLSNLNLTTTVESPKNVTGHQAGDPVIISKKPRRYQVFSYFNTSAFAYSLFLICFLLNQKIFHSVKSLIRLRNLAIGNAILIWFCYAFGSIYQYEKIVSWTVIFFLSLLLIKRIMRKDFASHDADVKSTATAHLRRSSSPPTIEGDVELQ